MERDTSAHPRATSDGVNVTGDGLTDEQLAGLTPEQRERLTSGEPLPIDPRSPLAPDSIRLAEPEPGRSAAAVALDQVEGTGDGDGDGRMDHGTPGDDVRETETGATTDATIEARNADAAGETVTVTGTPIADGVERDLDDDGTLTVDTDGEVRDADGNPVE